MNIHIQDQDLPMLLKMVERGWSSGDLAEYLEADQIVSCERVLTALGLIATQDPAPTGHPGQQHQPAPSKA
jgi:hypothetical protein